MSNLVICAAIGAGLIGILWLATIWARPKPLTILALPKLPTPEVERAIAEAERAIDEEKIEELKNFVEKIQKENHDARKNGLDRIAGILGDTDKRIRSGK